MDLVNESGMEVSWLVTKIEPPEFSLVAIVKGTFSLTPGGAAPLAGKQLPLTGDQFVDDDPAKPLLYPSDFAPFKPRADLLLAGAAHPAGGKSAELIETTFQVGSHFSKRLVIHGDRHWLRRNESTVPAAFVSLPITWDRAFGGPGFEANPLGIGLNPQLQADGASIHVLPNIEYPGDALRNTGQKIAPAGYGPIPDTWKERMAKAGSFGGNYVTERWPFYPGDFDYAFFNTAPADQQVDWLRGDEEIYLRHLHPEHAELRCRLPGLRVRCFLNERVRAHREVREVPLRLDTLWVNAGAALAVLVWRGHVTVRSEKLPGILHLFAVTEPAGQPAIPVPAVPGLIQDALARRAADDEELEPEAEPEDEVEAEIEEPAEPEEAGDDEAPPRIEPAPANDDEPDEAADDEAVADEEVPDPDEPPTLEQIKAGIATRASFDGVDLSGMNLSGLNFSGLSLREALLEGTLLTGANLSEVDFSGAVLAGANLNKANVSGANFTGADLTGVAAFQADFSRAIFDGADLTAARLRLATLRGAHGMETIFCQSDLSDAVLEEAGFPAADFGDAQLHRANLIRADLTEASFEKAWGWRIKAAGANLRKARAAGALFGEADFSSVKADESVWEMAQLSGANFSRASLKAAEFSSAFLAEANLDAAEMRDARLIEADLRAARLRRCNLFAASLDQAELAHADCAEANLFEATLMGATLRQTNFAGANLRRIRRKEKIA